MNVRTKFNIVLTLITAGILILFAVSIFWSSKKIRQEEFYEALRKEASIKTHILVDANISAKGLDLIYADIDKEYDKIYVVIYDASLNELYRNYPPQITADSLKNSLKKIQLDKGYLAYNSIQSIAAEFEIDGNNFYVLASGKDNYGQDDLLELLYTLIITFILAIILIYAIGFYFSKRIFSPVTEMTQDINNITSAHLDLRLKSHKYKGELNKLAAIFNQMLDRLENSFDSQKEFVAHMSHELRTPLAAIITDIELALSQPQPIKEYQETLERSLSDAKKIVRLSNNLLDLAKANYDPLEVGYSSLRIDEVLLEAYQEIKKSMQDCSIQIEFESDSMDEEMMTVMGNPYLLKVACKNLIENACKFSTNQHCLIRIGFNEKMVKVDFIDKGIGISAEELEHIFTPFYRGSSQVNYEGYGIGLALSQKIMQQHKGEIKVLSELNQGSKFTVFIPHRAGS